MVITKSIETEKRYGHVITATFKLLLPIIHFHLFTIFLRDRHPPLDPLVFLSHLTRLGCAIPFVTPCFILQSFTVCSAGLLLSLASSQSKIWAHRTQRHPRQTTRVTLGEWIGQRVCRSRNMFNTASLLVGRTLTGHGAPRGTSSTQGAYIRIQARQSITYVSGRLNVKAVGWLYIRRQAWVG
jgi:hypothetical protein